MRKLSYRKSRCHEEALKICKEARPIEMLEPKSVSERTENQESVAVWLRERRKHLFSEAFKEGVKNRK